MDVLNKGKQFIITSTEKDKNAVILDYKIGMERLAYAVRATNPAKQYTQKYSGSQYNSSINKEVISKINTDRWGPPMGTKMVETDIKNLREALYNEIKNIKFPRRASNITPHERTILADIKKNSKITVVETDKTNKLCVVEKTFIEDKMQELMDSSQAFELIESPSKNKIVTQAKNAAKELLLFTC